MQEASSNSGVVNSPGSPGKRSPLRDFSYWAYREKPKTIAWSRTVRKEAKGIDGLNLGRVQAVEAHHVRTAKGLLRKETFLIPRELVQAFDGSTLWFDVKPGHEHRMRMKVPPTRDQPSMSSPFQPNGTRIHAGLASKGFCPVFWTSQEKLFIA